MRCWEGGGGFSWLFWGSTCLPTGAGGVKERISVLAKGSPDPRSLVRAE